VSSRLLSKNFKIKMYKIIILRVVSYGCESCFLVLKEEYELGVFENRVLRRIFGAKREKMAGGWRPRLGSYNFM
jgi:hypothetical protein